MEQEGSLDFKALRAKFQEEAALIQMKNKPAIPEKPKLIPPPGARVSLLSSINAAVENKNPVIPRVVFKDAKIGSEAKRLPPLPLPIKPPVRDSNFNTDVLDHQQKKEGDVVKKAFKDRKLPRVLPVSAPIKKSGPAPPMKSVPPKKKAFLFKSKFSKAGKESTEISTGLANTSEVPLNTSEVPLNTSEVPLNTNEVPLNISEVPLNTNEVPLSTSEVLVNTSEVLVNTSEVLVNTSEGPVDTNESHVDTSEVPADTSEVPANPSEVPANTSEGPANTSEGPANTSEGPANTSEGPANTSEGPANTSEGSASTSEGPASTSEGPASTSEGPASTSEGPANTSEGPANTSEGPANTSEGLASTSEGPASTSEGPASTSEGPAKTSESPANTSEGPASISGDPPSIIEGSLNTADSPSNVDEAPIPPSTAAEEIDGEAPKLENGNMGLCSEPQSQSSERADAPPSGDERADKVSTGSRTPPCDHRVLNALEKAKKKFAPFNSRPNSTSPVNGDQSCEVTPSRLCPELPPIDYEDPIGDVPSTASVSPDNKLDSSSLRQSSPSLAGSVEQGMEELIPPPRKFLPDLEHFGPSPGKPARPPSVDLSSYLTTAPEAYVGNALEAPALPDLSFAAPEFDATESEPVEFEVPQLEAPDVPDFETSDFEAPHLLTHEVGALEYGEPEALDLGALNVGALDLGPLESGDVELGDPEIGSQETETPEAEAPGTTVPDSPGLPTNKESELQPGVQQEESHYESCDIIYEDVEVKFRRGQNARKRKGPPKNPYAETQPVSEESHKSSWFFNSRNERKASPEAHDDKEQKKKEKHRLEKEKKEQKEREKKENEMKKKFQITGLEEPMYHAKVIFASKGRKNDLPVKSGDIVSIIRTTNCPKGKWLARDNNNKYGYISVESVELDIKEMLELGKKASQAAGRTTAIEAETTSLGSRSSNHYPLSACSFTDDSEEWTCDDDDTLSPVENIGNGQTAPMTEVFGNHGDVQHALVDGSSDGNNIQARHEALQKLATFFQQPRETTETAIEDSPTAGPEEQPSLLNPAEEQTYLSEQEEDVEILPPPDLYADSVDDVAVE